MCLGYSPNYLCEKFTNIRQKFAIYAVNERIIHRSRSFSSYQNQAYNVAATECESSNLTDQTCAVVAVFRVISNSLKAHFDDQNRHIILEGCGEEVMLEVVKKTAIKLTFYEFVFGSKGDAHWYNDSHTAELY